MKTMNIYYIQLYSTRPDLYKRITFLNIVVSAAYVYYCNYQLKLITGPIVQ